MQHRKILCALDTESLDEAIATVRKLAPHVGGFKIGHALTLPNGLNVLDRLRNAGASRIFLDLKFHDIPNSVGLAVREAARHGVWMMTLHISGGRAMMAAAAEQARSFGVESAPLLIGVSVLTSLDEEALKSQIGVERSLEDQMVFLSRLALESGLDGVVCSPQEISPIRQAIGASGIIVTPGIRLPQGPTHDQVRTGSARQALADGADYLVVGRALTEASDVEAALAGMDLETANSS